ncbi:hypothetical protein GCM10023085_80860 [Actinomadura viridis]|uniref:Uncharacterized protein n=1 Tax=Actinomadura viridis TaxID=58110 RepID=A0A931DM89_9ACTN|nr:hypothetical protein [Actinomadura viridis]MBG6092122.1 hypothetical protein [Actinomadura viridis]
MDIDQISTLVREHAARFGLRHPTGAVAGQVPSWLPFGLQVRRRRGGRVLVVDPRFGDLSPSEQSAMIAGVMTAAACFPAYLRRLILVSVPLVLVAGVAGGLMSAFLGSPRVLGVLLLFLGWIPAVVLVMRWFAYTVDRAVVETFGRPTLDAAFGFERRSPLKRGHPIRLISPNVDQRVQRVERLERLRTPSGSPM